jgi:predicted nucleic acid-binding protein
LRPHEVPAGPLALDTNVFSMLHNKRGDHAAFAALVAGHPLALSFAVVGELKVGAIRGKLGARRRQELDRAIAACVVIPSDARVVDKWTELHARFLGRLKGGGINDLWTAAAWPVHGFPIATADLGDFQQIAGEFTDLLVVHPDV